MIQVDISNIWSQVSLPQLLSVEPELAEAHRAVVERSGEGREYMGWTGLPDKFPTAEHVRILAAAEHIRRPARCWWSWPQAAPRPPRRAFWSCSRARAGT